MTKKERGRLITFEGIEAVGKSTQAQTLADQLRFRRFDVTTTRDPGGGEFGNSIRALMKRSSPKSPLAERLIYLATATEQIENVILPALEDGEWVVADRYVESSAAYQGGADLRGQIVSIELESAVEKLECAIEHPAKPDLTFLLDLPADEARQRALKRGNDDKYDNAPTTYYNLIRSRYLQMASDDPDQYVVINAAQPPAELSCEIFREVEKRFIVPYYGHKGMAKVQT